MGIPGIYQEIGPGDRIALSKLAVQTLEETGRPLRLAIDISIWQFQAQAAKGGSNPAIRTLFYRLVRLQSHTIKPIFVFDGPNKPAMKRGRRTGGGRSGGNVVSTAMAKQLIRLFGFYAHDAPGEAEAECALLQRRGVVDAVLSEDVDTIMFGCTRTLRSWSAEKEKGSGSSGPPTHVTVYDSAAIARPDAAGLDREGMVLVALMSGGDYDPDGIPGCGVKVACQAARAGFGRSLCKIKRSDPPSVLAAWREGLRRDLADNVSGSFSRRNKAVAAAIPDDFPDMEVLGYYTHPVVSRDAALERLKISFSDALVGGDMNLLGLRDFTANTFDWTGKGGAIKFIRVLGPSLLVQKMLLPSLQQHCLVEAILKRRVDHPSNGRIPELRVSFLPLVVVDIDLDAEPDETLEAHGRGGLALNSDDEFEDAEAPGSTQGGGPKKVFDPSQPDVVWIPESVVRLGAPEVLRSWEAEQGAKRAAASAPKKKTAASAPKATRTRRTKAAPPSHTMERYLKATKKVSAPTGLGSTKPGILPDRLDGLSSHGSPNPESDSPPTRQTRSLINVQLKENRERVEDYSISSNKQTKTIKRGTPKDATNSAGEPSLPPAVEHARSGSPTTDRTPSSSVISSAGTTTGSSKNASYNNSINIVTRRTPKESGRDGAADNGSCSPPLCHRSPPPRWKPVAFSSSPPSAPASPQSLPLTSSSPSLREHAGSPMPENSLDDPDPHMLSSSPPRASTSPRKRRSSGTSSSETSPTRMMGRLNISSAPDSTSAARTTRAGHARSGSSANKTKQTTILGFVKHGSEKQQAAAQNRAPARRERSAARSPPRRSGRGQEGLARPAASSPPRLRRPPSVISLSSDDDASEPERKPTAEAAGHAAEPTAREEPARHGGRAQVAVSVGSSTATAAAAAAAATAAPGSAGSGHDSEYSDEDTWATAESRLPPPPPPDAAGGPGEDGNNMTRLYRSRRSAAGYMCEVEVSREEADRIMREEEEEARADGRRRRRRLYRRSDLFVIDLTDEP
ncbi:hypothetical protein RB594_006452 [Gaeumannomyces avenae]